MTDFLDLQNGWYNGFIQGMGQTDSSFQIIQPAPPLVPSSGQTQLWGYFNNIPPSSLTQNFIASGGNQFYSDYRGLMSALEPTRKVNVEQDIGTQNYQNWQQYVRSLPTPPSINQYPTLFRSWAILNAPDVANIGASDYSVIMLDPIASAQTELTLSYTDVNGQAKPFNWSLGFEQMTDALAKSPSRSFNFSSATMNSNVSSSWTGGSDSGFFGLWGGSDSKSSVSKTFASSSITVNASFEHVLTFSDTPGNWYSSSAMGLAYANKTGNPWSPNSSINWDNTFGSNGNMQRFMANLIIASGMQVSVTSTASYSSEQQTEIHNNSHAGFWPFYSSGGGSSSSNTVTFDQSGAMTITTASQPGVPVVLGGNVLGVGQFVGHSTEAALMLARALAA